MLGILRFVRNQKLPVGAVAHRAHKAPRRASAVGAPCSMEWWSRRRQRVSAAISELGHSKCRVERRTRRMSTTSCTDHDRSTSSCRLPAGASRERTASTVGSGDVSKPVYSATWICWVCLSWGPGEQEWTRRDVCGTAWCSARKLPARPGRALYTLHTNYTASGTNNKIKKNYFD